MCITNNCNKPSTYNYKNQNKALYCYKCKLDGMIYIRKSRCIICNNKQPTFEMPGEKKAHYCNDCKLDGMVNIKSPKCIICNNKQPTFEMPGEKKAHYCGDCKLDGMIDIINPKCIICNNKYTSFGMPKDKIPNYCNRCKLDGMVNIKSPKCIICNNKQPTFEMPGEKKAHYCGDCKLDGMIDIINPKCIICNNKRTNFGLPDDKKAQYCRDCKLDGMIDIRHPKCKSSWCSTRYNPKYDGYCSYCFIHLFPDKYNTRNYKSKEISVINYIKEHLSHIDIITDKKIEDGCSKRRPDIMIDVGFQIIIIEVDENQHNQYDCSCENKRLMELSLDVGFRSIVFIRFNPDSYKINNKKITSCWHMNKLGIYQINKKKINEWNDRLKNLKETIEYWCNPEHKIDKIIEIIQLYYNQ